jgi:hypothetical protein
MEYALCWRQSPVVLFPLKEKEKRQKDEKQKQENLKIPSNWDLLSSPPPLYKPAVPPAQVLEPAPVPPPQASASPPPPPNPSTSTPFNSLPPHSLPETCPYCDFKRNYSNVVGTLRIYLFLSLKGKDHIPFPLRKVHLVGVILGL